MAKSQRTSQAPVEASAVGTGEEREVATSPSNSAVAASMQSQPVSGEPLSLLEALLVGGGANAGMDTVNSIKAAAEFGLT